MRWRHRLLVALTCVAAITAAPVAFAQDEVVGTETDAQVDGPSILHIREGAADAETAARITAVNEQWMSENPGRTPALREEYRPKGSALLWRFYRNQGFFPNWVTAARDVLRRQRAGEAGRARASVNEIVSYSARRVAPDGTAFRMNDSVYLSTDSTAPPWRDAMGQGLILSTLIPTLDENSTERERGRILTLATEYLNSFAVDWRDGGVATDGKAGGMWFLEYATPRGDQSRILNGFAQSIVSLDRFATQADALAAQDPRWGELRDRARGYVYQAALEVDAHLDVYDLHNGLSRYSLKSMDPAPETYQVYHRQLLQLLQNIEYLPKEWRDHFDRVRVAWGGEKLGDSGRPWWHWAVLAAIVIAVVLIVLRIRAQRRRARRRRRQIIDHGVPPPT